MMNFTATLTLILATTLLPMASLAFMSVQESNEITPMGKFKLGAEPQYRTSRGSGFNFSGFVDAPLSEELSARASVGTGDTDLSLGGSLKWVPIPDFESQPAIGAKIGFIYWREGSDNLTTVRLEPLVSKKIAFEFGHLIPYASLPVMFNNGNNNNKTSLQVALGSELYHKDADNMTFGAEVGLDGKDSFSYISGFVTIYIEENPH